MHIYLRQSAGKIFYLGQDVVALSLIHIFYIIVSIHSFATGQCWCHRFYERIKLSVSLSVFTRFGKKEIKVIFKLIVGSCFGFMTIWLLQANNVILFMSRINVMYLVDIYVLCMYYIYIYIYIYILYEKLQMLSLIHILYTQ